MTLAKNPSFYEAYPVHLKSGTLTLVPSMLVLVGYWEIQQDLYWALSTEVLAPIAVI